MKDTHQEAAKDDLSFKEYKKLFLESKFIEVIDGMSKSNRTDVKDSRYSTLLIQSYLKVADYKSAYFLAKSCYESYPDQRTFQRLFIVASFRHGKINKLKEPVERYVKLYPDKQILVISAKILCKECKWEECGTALNDLHLKEGYQPDEQFIKFALESERGTDGVFEILKFCSTDELKLSVLKRAAKIASKNECDLDEYLFRLAAISSDQDCKFLNRRLDKLEAALIVKSMAEGVNKLPDGNTVKKWMLNNAELTEKHSLRKKILMYPCDDSSRRRYIETLVLGEHRDAHDLATLHHLFSILIGETKTSRENERGEICFEPSGDIDFYGDEEILIKEKPGSNNLIIIFTGGRGRVTEIPLILYHSINKNIDANIIYLRDRLGLSYSTGIKSLGESVVDTANYLAKIARNLEVKNISCLGNSAGGFAALLYGRLIKAQRICSICGPTTFNHLYNVNDGRGNPEVLELIQESSTNDELDLINLYKKSDQVQDIHCYYGKDMPQDSWQAERFKDIPGVQTFAIDGVDKHWLILWLYRSGRLYKIANNLIAEN